MSFFFFFLTSLSSLLKPASKTKQLAIFLYSAECQLALNAKWEKDKNKISKTIWKSFKSCCWAVLYSFCAEAREDTLLLGGNVLQAKMCWQSLEIFCLKQGGNNFFIVSSLDSFIIFFMEAHDCIMTRAQGCLLFALYCNRMWHFNTHKTCKTNHKLSKSNSGQFKGTSS